MQAAFEALQLPALVAFYTAAIEPLWCAISPLLLPLATLAVSACCLQHLVEVPVSVTGLPTSDQSGLVRTTLLGLNAVSWHRVLDTAAHAICGLAAAVSSGVLWAHAGSKLRGLRRHDPLVRQLRHHFGP